MPYNLPYRFCPRCGREGFALRPPHVFVCDGCGHRHHINPICGVAAILRDAADHVLLIRRAKDPGAGCFGLPGGFVDPDETAEVALLREVREEVGLELGAIRFLGSFANDYAYRGAVLPVLDLVFTAEVADFRAAAALDEVAGLEIVPRARVPVDEMAFRSLRAALARYLEAGPGI